MHDSDELDVLCRAMLMPSLLLAKVCMAKDELAFFFNFILEVLVRKYVGWKTQVLEQL